MMDPSGRQGGGGGRLAVADGAEQQQQADAGEENAARDREHARPHPTERADAIFQAEQGEEGAAGDERERGEAGGGEARKCCNGTARKGACVAGDGVVCADVGHSGIPD